MSSSFAVERQLRNKLSVASVSHSGVDTPARWSRKVALDIVAMLDVLAVVVGAFFPVIIYSTFGGLSANVLLTFQSSLAAAVIVVLLLNTWGMYEPSMIHDLPDKPGRILGSLIIAFVAVLGLGIPYIIKESQLWVWYATWGWATYTLLLANHDISKHVLKKFTVAGRFDKRVAVFGAGKIARRVHDQFKDPALGVNFVGVYDDRFEDGRADPEGLEMAGGLEDLIASSRAEKIDQIVIALPQVAEGRMAAITKKLERLPVSVHIVTHIASDLVAPSVRHKVSSMGDVGMLDVKTKALSDWAPIIKRCEDLVIGSVGLLAAAVLTPVIALAIKLESSGPVLFTQRRRGLNMREFDVLKFRTMLHVEGEASVDQAKQGDPRVTMVGKFLRRFSLDELPQFVNVLKGEMSLVGPRPHAIAHDDEFVGAFEQYANRHQVKPGITGLAQVKGFRGETSTLELLEARVLFDIEYIKTWSLWLDLKILADTVWTVFVGKNAY